MIGYLAKVIGKETANPADTPVRSRLTAVLDGAFPFESLPTSVKTREKRTPLENSHVGARFRRAYRGDGADDRRRAVDRRGRDIEEPVEKDPGAASDQIRRYGGNPCYGRFLEAFFHSLERILLIDERKHERVHNGDEQRLAEYAADRAEETAVHPAV